MKTIMLLWVCLFFMSCSNELDVMDNTAISSELKTKSLNVENEDYFQVIDGCLKFKDYDNYIVVNELLMNKTNDELKEWKSSFDYISLYDEYQRISPLEYFEEKDYNVVMDQDTINNKVKSSMYATLLNSRGMLMIGDTILKVKDEYTYMVKNGNMDVVRMIEEGKDVSAFDSIERSRHTIFLTSKTRNTSQTPVYKVSSSRREFVQLNAFISGSGSSLLTMEIKGRAQKKSLWWGIDFEDELAWGQIFTNGGYYSGSVYYPLNITSTIQRDVCVVSSSQLLAKGTLRNVTIQVKNTFCKALAQGNLEYTNNYNFYAQ